MIAMVPPMCDDSWGGAGQNPDTLHLCKVTMVSWRKQRFRHRRCALSSMQKDILRGIGEDTVLLPSAFDADECKLVVDNIQLL